MGERHLFAYFHSPDEAASLIPKLRVLKADNIQIERAEQGVTRPNLGFPGEVVGFSPDADFTGRGVYFPFGMFAEGEELPDGRDTILTATIDEASYEQAAHLIRTSGGYLNE